MGLYNEENASPTVANSFAERLERGIAQGLEQGIDLGVEKTASKMLQMGLDLQMIVEATGVSLEKVGVLQETIAMNDEN